MSSQSKPTIHVHVHKCRNLAPKDVNGKSDPYVVHMHPSGLKKKSSIIKKTLNPSWATGANSSVQVLRDFQLKVLMAGEIELQCWDHDTIGSDDFEGRVVISVAQFLAPGMREKNRDGFVYSRDSVWLKLVKRFGKPKEKVSGDILVSMKLEVPNSDCNNVVAKALEVYQNAGDSSSSSSSSSTSSSSSSSSASKSSAPKSWDIIKPRQPSKKGVPYDAIEVKEFADKIYIINLCSEPRNFNAVEEYIKQRKDINVEFMGQTPMHKAAEKGGPKIVDLLAKNGGNLDAVDKDKWTPLLQASVMGKIDTSEVLLDYGANPNLANKDGETALYMAVHMQADAKYVQLLLEFGADTNIVHPSNGTPLHYARKKKLGEIARLLEQFNAADEGPAPPKKDEKDKELPSLPEEGAKAPKFEWVVQPTIKQIMASKDPDSITKAWSAFQEQVSKVFQAIVPHVIAGDLGNVERWLDYHSENLPAILQAPHEGDGAFGETSPLVAAAETKQTKIYERLLKAGCDPTWHLGEACSYGLENAVIALVESGANVNKKYPTSTPLLYALEAKKDHDKYVTIPQIKERPLDEFVVAREQIIKLLLEKGVDPKGSPSENWMDYLQWAQKNGTDADGQLLDPTFKREEKLEEVHPLKAPMVSSGTVSVKLGTKLSLVQYLPNEVRAKANTVEFKPVEHFANCIAQPVPKDGEGYTIGYEFEVSKKCPGFLKSTLSLYINAFTVGNTCYAKEMWYTFEQGKDDAVAVNPIVDHIDVVTEPIIQYSSSRCKTSCDRTQRFCILICYQATEPWGERKRVQESLLKKVDATCKLELGDDGNAAAELPLLPQWVMPKLNFQ